MSEPGSGPRRIAPGLILTIAVLIAGILFSSWRHQVLVAAIKGAGETVAIVAALLALLAAVEFLLRGRARLWGRIGVLAAVSGVLFWRLFSSGSTITAMLAGVVWAGTIGTLVVLMLRNPQHGR